ncbi:hypothetical protein BDA96_02G327000 [Sorghum bicolor]|uniref:Uncharacterized protein n=1 Tax=Sorghum bicolor TaxID=4558 RepID=A0A921RSG3_SORBI|nr:hypothetical protein BDA96_02G327000 [Sorghum bicolor]
MAAGVVLGELPLRARLATTAAAGRAVAGGRVPLAGGKARLPVGAASVRRPRHGRFRRAASCLDSATAVGVAPTRARPPA